MSFFIKPSASFTESLPKKGDFSGAPRPERKEPTTLPVGRHSVKITEVSAPKANPTDKTWMDINLTFVAESGKKTWGDVSIPLEKDTFTTSKGDEVPGPAYKAISFLDAVFNTRELTADSIRRTVGDLRKVSGKALDVEVGYRNAYAKYEDKVFKLVVNGVSQPGEFANRDAVEAHAKQKGIRFDRFPKVLKFYKPAQVVVEVKNIDIDDPY